MDYAYYAAKESFQTVPETCQKVEEVFGLAEATVKEQTNALRDALTDAIRARMVAEDEVTSLEDQVKDLKRELSFIT